MLNSLRGKTKLEAQKILHGISENLLPNPYVESTTDFLSSSDVLNEIRSLLKINSDDFSDLARAKIYKLIASELTQLILPTKKIKSVRERVGQKGALLPSLYQVKYGETYKSQAKEITFSSKDVELTVTNPDTYDHFFDENNEGSQVSLFSKSFFSNISKNRYDLLVFGIRTGATIEVLNSWYLFSNNYKGDKSISAIGKMKELLEEYGIEMKLLIDNSIGKLFLSKKFSSYNIPKLEDLISISSVDKRNSYVFVFGSMNPIAHQSVLGLAFVMDLKKYHDYLRLNGVKVNGI